MTKIIQERIISSSDAPLTSEDLQILHRKKAAQGKFLLFGYLPLALILLYVFVSGDAVVGRNKGLHTVEMDDEKMERYNTVLPWVCGFFFIVLTSYFLHGYLKTFAPIIRDIKRGKKSLLSFKVDKKEMSVFDKYYITTPIRKSQLVRVEREDFYRINDAGNLTLELGPDSCVVLGVSQDGWKIRTIDQL